MTRQTTRTRSETLDHQNRIYTTNTNYTVLVIIMQRRTNVSIEKENRVPWHHQKRRSVEMKRKQRKAGERTAERQPFSAPCERESETAI